MPTLQSANQHRQSSWSFDIKEEGSLVSTERKKGGKAKRTVYENECKVCGNHFTSESNRQPIRSSLGNRYGKVEEIMNNLNSRDKERLALKRPFTATSYLLPIPQSALDINSNLNQNPGY